MNPQSTGSLSNKENTQREESKNQKGNASNCEFKGLQNGNISKSEEPSEMTEPMKRTTPSRLTTATCSQKCQGQTEKIK